MDAGSGAERQAGMGMSQDATPPSVYLNIGSREEQEEFLKELLPSFLEIVGPWESGLLDLMIAEGLMTDTDRESLSAKDVCTPKDLRRKVWFHLSRLSVHELRAKVFHKLYEEYYHIIPRRFLTVDEGCLRSLDRRHGNECLRHEIMRRVRPDSVIDKMYEYGYLDLEDYRTMFLGGCNPKEVWERFFSLQPSQIHSTPSMIKDLLEMHRIPSPSDLASLLADGICCTCSETHPALPAPPLLQPRRKENEIQDVPWPQKQDWWKTLPSETPEKVESWIELSPFWCRPSSYGSGSSSTKSTNLFSVSSDRPLWKPESVVSSGLPMDPCPLRPGPRPSPNVCFTRKNDVGVDERGGQVPGPTGKPPQHRRGTARQHNPSAEQVGHQAVSKPGQIGNVALNSSLSHVIDVAGDRDDPSFTGRLSPAQHPAVRSPREGFALKGKLMSGVSEIKNFLERHCLIVIAFLAVSLLLVLTMNGFHVFQLTHGYCKSSEENFANVKQLLAGHDKQLMKNFTSSISEELKRIKEACKSC